MSNKISAVLTGDIVNSTRLGTRTVRKLITGLEGLFKGKSFEFYRGDSFQILETDPAVALKLALRCRCLAIILGTKEEKSRSDIRISIGIGKTGVIGTKLGATSGEAFLLSGRAFDEMEKAEKRLAISVANPMAAVGLSVIAGYADAIFSQLTIKQADLYRMLLSGASQLEAARELKKSQSTVHQYVVSGRWYETERILLHYEQIIKLLS